ncbi:peptidoglycan-binding domain-containing protein [Salininema proteolyticum]|uniref:Peptidoglycan-binding protein n=1 Tax=Salininema proteolyticum TaxID=1607685 RepID=A0ABV8TWK2_9ACTN
MSWRLANSLVRLRDEIDALAPGRSKRSDGTIGDPAHQGTDSDHNPNAQNVVCALDITHDPGAGVDIDALTDHLVHPDKRHSNLKYVIANRLIAGIHTGWEWWTYRGSNPHTAHMHISVGRGPDGSSGQPYDDANSWKIADPGGGDPGDGEYGFPLPAGFYFGWAHWGDESISGWYGERYGGRLASDWLKLWARRLIERGWDIGKGKKYLTRYGNDGKYGDEWDVLVRAFQRDRALKVDGLIGPVTWAAAFKD